MNTGLLVVLVIGILCVVAAIVGGGLKLSDVEFPPLTSRKRQVLLAVVGLMAIALSIVLEARSSPAAPPVAQSSTTAAPVTAATSTAATSTTEQPTTPTTPSVIKSSCAIQINPTRKSRAADFVIAINGSGYQPNEQVRYFLVLDTKDVLEDGKLLIGGQTLAEATADGQGAVQNVQGKFNHVEAYNTGPHFVVGLGMSSTCKADRLFIVDDS